MAVLIHSFDGYKRFWGPVLHLSAASLPPELPVFFASEREPATGNGATSILTGKGAFGDRMRKAVDHLRGLGYEYVLYLQEDMWISEEIDSRRFREFIDLMETHKLDALKLADLAAPPPEIDELGRRCSRLGRDGLAAEVRWFGSHDYVFSHHTTIFRSSFLAEVLTVASLFRRVKPLQQEQFCSAYLKRRSVASDRSGGRYRIAGFADEPLLRYIHASTRGRLTDAARTLLEERGLAHLYAPDLPGEFYPDRRGQIQ